MMSKLRDGFYFASRLSLRRLWNAALVISSFYYSRLSRSSRPWGLPISLSVEPTTACNLACPECPSGLRQFTRPTGNMKMPLFDRVLEELAPSTAYMIFYFQGEPYIHPGLFEMISKAHDRGLYTATSTNAHFLDPENARKTVSSGLSRLIISVDGSSQEVYEQYRRKGELDKVIAGTRHIVEARKAAGSRTPHIIWQMLVVRPNEHQVEEIRRLGRDLGVDEVRFKTAQLYDYRSGHTLMPLNPRYSRYKESSPGRYEVKSNLENHCWRMWHSAVITQNGAVVPCCFDKDAEHRLGQLSSERSFAQIWHSAPYRSFRAQLMRGRKEVAICTNCSEGVKVWG